MRRNQTNTEKAISQLTDDELLAVNEQLDILVNDLATDIEPMQKLYIALKSDIAQKIVYR